MKLTSEEQEILFLTEHQQFGSNNTHAAMQISLTNGMAGQAWFASSIHPSDPLLSYATTSMHARFIHEGTVCVIRGESSGLIFFLLSNFTGSTCDPYIRNAKCGTLNHKL
jgi:hypothetical protein